jgi:hypothetical protein
MTIRPCCTFISSSWSPQYHAGTRFLQLWLPELLIASELVHSRFLRARNFQLPPAQKQFAAAETWRKTHEVDRLYAMFDTDEFEFSKRFYPRWTGRRDKVCLATRVARLLLLIDVKNGLPLYVYRIQSVVPIQHEIEAVPPERRFQRMYVRSLLFLP